MYPLLGDKTQPCFGITYLNGEIRGDKALKSKGGFSSIVSQIALLPYALASVHVDCSTMCHLFSA